VRLHRPAHSRAEHRLGQTAGRVAAVDRPRQEITSGTLWALVGHVMLQRAYVRSAQRLARRDDGGG
jgi:hypothetical protein